LHATAAQIRRRCGNAPIDALAASLGCEFLARAAVERPAAWGRLALVSPTGLNGTRSRRGPTGSTRAMPTLHAFLSVPLWSEALYRGLTKPSVVRYFLERTWGSKAVDEALWAYDVRTARQPGARFAPLHFLAGSLFSDDIHTVYESVKQPVWMSHGVRGDFADYRSKGIVKACPNWQFSVFPTGALPYFEEPEDFLRTFDAFVRSESSFAGARPSATAARI
jgi:pimeloyl-ACP methyl ester carboxylesterase